MSVDIEDGSVILSNVNTDQERSTTSLQLKLNLNSLVGKYWIFLISAALSAVGNIGGPLLLRLYFIYGGKRKWIPAWVLSSGFPILLIPFLINYLRLRSDLSSSSEKFFISPKLTLCASILGLLYGVDNFSYTLGLSYLPVSTSSIIYSTYLFFLAFFALFIVRQKFTPYSVNAIVMMILGSVLLGIRQSGDKPPGVTSGQYLLGFLATLGSAASVGLVIPCTELVFTKVANNIMTYSSFLQFQFCLSMSSTLFSTLGMIINKDFTAIPREAKEFGLGESKYYLVLIFTSVIFQLSVIGTMGMIFSASALASGVFSAMLLPLTSVGGVIAYHEKFSGEKGISLAMCFWGLASYSYGTYRNTVTPSIESQL